MNQVGVSSKNQSSLPSPSGQLCEIPPSPLSLCELADCQNNAPCVERGGRALCQCPPEFGGPRCEKLVSVNFVDRDSYLLLSDLKNWPQANITLQACPEALAAFSLLSLYLFINHANHSHPPPSTPPISVGFHSGG